MRILVVATMLAALVSAPGPVRADWPQLRGPNVDGVVADHGVLSRAASVKLAVRWKRPLGSGYSSVVVSNGRVITAACDETSNFVVCLDALTGSELWRRATGPKWKGSNGSSDGPIATPAVGDGRVFALLPDGALVALSLADGAVLWSIDVAKTYGAQPIFYGFGASPILHGGELLIALGPPTGTLAAFDPESGRLLWSSGNDSVAFQTPTPVKWFGRQLVIAAGNTRVSAIDTRTRQELWSFDHGGSGGRGAWSLIPTALGEGRLFLAHDDAESQVIQAPRAPSLPASSVWRSRTIRNSYNVPLVVGDKIYAYSARILVCVDPATGELVWRSRPPGDGFLAAIDGRLVILTKSGALHLVRVDRGRYEPLSEVEVFDELAWSVPAIDGDAVYVRSLGEVARIDIVPGDPSPDIRSAQPDALGAEFQLFLDRVASAEDKDAEVDRFFAGIDGAPFVEGETVHFLLRGDYQDVAVAGDLFGVRQERRMERVPGTDLFYYAVRTPGDTRANYVFVADFVSIPDPRNPRRVRSSMLVEDMEMSFLNPGEPLEMSYFDMPQRRRTIEPDAGRALRGAVHPVTLRSASMGREIELTVYTPPRYAQSAQPFPVVVVHEGAEARSAGGLVAILDQLFGEERIPGAVVAFVDYRFGPMTGAPGYEAMIGDELLPLLEERFRISDQRRDRCQYGAGFGGILALTSGLSNRESIGRVAVQSPYRFEFLDPLIKQSLDRPGPGIAVYAQVGRFDAANPEEGWDMAENAQGLLSMIRAAGHAVEFDTVNDGFDWSCWRTHVEEVFGWLLTQKQKAAADP